jgi:glycosyltransferase involved in cell wall biosynthesis
MFITENEIKEYANSERMLVIIPVFNQKWFLENTIEKLRRLELSNIIIFDNGSTYPPLLHFYHETKIPVCVFPSNPGPRHFAISYAIWQQLPNIFIVTDPDLEYPDEIPKTVVQDLIDLTSKHQLGKIGLALDRSQENLYASNLVHHIRTGEDNFWKKIIDTTSRGDAIYKAKIDTTFALYRKEFCTKWKFEETRVAGLFFKAPRVAGRYCCYHYGWYKDRPGPQVEHEYYDNHKTKWSSTPR